MTLLLLRLRTWYKVHRWTAIVAGIALAMWLITGLAMTWRQLFPEPGLQESASHNYREASISPADISQRLKENYGTTQVVWLDLREILDSIVYVAQLESGETVLLDATSGQRIEISADMAKEIARRSLPTDARIQKAERIEYNSVNYPYGPVPVYEVFVDDPDRTRLFVSVNSGDIQYSERADRISVLLGSLHTFDALRLFTDRRRLITGLLMLAGLFTLVLPLLGYYLALPRRWQVLNRRK